MNSKSRFSRPKANGKFRKWPAYNENLRKRGSLRLWITPKAIKEWGIPEKIRIRPVNPTPLDFRGQAAPGSASGRN